MSSNLPPGVTQSMIDAQFEGPPCDICGFLPEDCICPECRVCQSQGDRKCYRDHGLQLTIEQVFSHQKFKIAKLREQLQEERMYAVQLRASYSDEAVPEDRATFHPEDFVHILELDKLPPQSEHERFPNIAKAALAIWYDNGMINRGTSEGEMLNWLDTALGAEGVYTKDLKAIDDWLGTLTEKQFDDICAGENEDMGEVIKGAPPLTGGLLDDIFNMELVIK